MTREPSLRQALKRRHVAVYFSRRFQKLRTHYARRIRPGVEAKWRQWSSRAWLARYDTPAVNSMMVESLTLLLAEAIALDLIDRNSRPVPRTSGPRVAKGRARAAGNDRALAADIFDRMKRETRIKQHYELLSFDRAVPYTGVGRPSVPGRDRFVVALDRLMNECIEGPEFSRFPKLRSSFPRWKFGAALLRAVPEARGLARQVTARALQKLAETLRRQR
jgi:hypothetical protein